VRPTLPTGAAQPKFWSLDGVACCGAEEIGRVRGVIVARAEPEVSVQRESLVMWPGDSVPMAWWTEQVVTSHADSGIPTLASLPSLGSGTVAIRPSVGPSVGRSFGQSPGRSGGPSSAPGQRCWARVVADFRVDAGDAPYVRPVLILVVVTPCAGWIELDPELREHIETVRPEHAFPPSRAGRPPQHRGRP
jgi:hypothetical protein